MSWLLVCSRRLAKHCDIARAPASSVRVATSCKDITRYWSRVLTSCYEKRTSATIWHDIETEFWRVYYDISTSIRELSTNLYKLGKHHWSGPLKLPTHNCESVCERTAYLESQGKPLQRHSIESFQRSWPTLHNRLVLKGAAIFLKAVFERITARS